MLSNTARPIALLRTPVVLLLRAEGPTATLFSPSVLLYKAQLPISIDGKYPIWEFTCNEDVWKVVDLLIQEIKDINESKGKEFDTISSVNAQLPFFTCRDNIFDRKVQKDIQRYLYCEKFGINPYKGDYGQQPCLWVDTTSIIRKYFAKLENKEIKKAKQDGTKINN